MIPWLYVVGSVDNIIKNTQQNTIYGVNLRKKETENE